MAKINWNRPQKVFNPDENIDPGIECFDEDFLAKKRAMMHYYSTAKADLSPGWADRLRMVKSAYATLKKVEVIDNPDAKITKCPERTQYHVPRKEATEQFERELKHLKKVTQQVSRKNKSGSQRHSSHCISKALDDRQAIYCRQNKAEYTIKALANKFGVSERCVLRCVKGITYKHLNSQAKPWL